MAIKAYHPFKPMMAPVVGVDTPDAHTAVIRTSTPHPALLLCMSPALCPILPKHIYDDGQYLPTHPRNLANVIGSGPFKWVEFNPNQRIVMERFDKFFLPGKPYLDKVIISINPDPASLMLSFDRGEIQMLPFVSNPSDLKLLAANARATLTPKGYEGIGGLNWLAFNLTRRPMSDLQVRKAIATAIDKNFICKVLMNGFAAPADGPIVPSSPFFAATDLVRYPFDLKKAATMLDAAGYKAGTNGERFKLTIDYQPGIDDQQKNVAEYIRGQLKKIGIAVELRASADFPAWAKRIAAHDFDMTMDQVWNWGDPVIGVARTYMSNNIKPIVWTNTQSYNNPAVDKLLLAAGSDLDSAKRKVDYAEFQKIVTEDLPIDFINLIPFHTAASKKMGNVPVTIWGPLSPYDEVYLA
jgi:peptide/nickel transport system substrate-binding protein